MDAKVGSVSRDRQIAALARRQHGVVSGAQLRALGVARGAIAHRVATGRLHRLHRGVFAVGHPLVSQHGRWIAAVLAVGADAVLSHRSAAGLLGILPTQETAIDVTTPRKAHPHPAIHVHRTSHLPRSEMTRIRVIPCTNVPRTLIDLGEVVTRRQLERALDQVQVEGLYDEEAVARALRRHRKRRGASVLRDVLAQHRPGCTLTRSELEERFLALCRHAELPSLELNVPLRLPNGDTVIVDALWRAHALVVETDGRAAHGTKAAFERDRRRDAQLLLAGYSVVRFTWRQVTGDPQSVATTLAGLLAGTSTPAGAASSGTAKRAEGVGFEPTDRG